MSERNFDFKILEPKLEVRRCSDDGGDVQLPQGDQDCCYTAFHLTAHISLVLNYC